MRPFTRPASLHIRRDVHTSSMNCSGNIDHPVRALHLRYFHNFLHCQTKAPDVTTTGIPQLGPRTAPVESPRASAVLHDSPRTLTLNIQSAKRHANVTQLVSIFSPRIAHDPILTLSKNCTCGISTGFSSSARQPTNTDSQHSERQTPCERNPTRLNILTKNSARSNTDLVRELQLWNFHNFLHCQTQAPVVVQQRVSQPVQELYLAKLRSFAQFALYNPVSVKATEPPLSRRTESATGMSTTFPRTESKPRLCMITGTSIPSMNCTKKTSTTQNVP